MAEIKFDQALKELEKLVEDMEEEELSLEDGLKKYEKGMKLSRICLEKAVIRVSSLPATTPPSSPLSWQARHPPTSADMYIERSRWRIPWYP